MSRMDRSFEPVHSLESDDDPGLQEVFRGA